MTNDAEPELSYGQQGRATVAIDAYLRWVVEDQKRGRSPLSSAELDARAAAETNLARKVILLQQAMDAHERESKPDPRERLEAEFRQYAPWFAAKHKISYAAWRQMGVPAAMLASIGIHPVRPVTHTPARDKRAPDKRARRRKMTPEFAQELLDVWEGAGGDEKVPGSSMFKGHLAVAEAYGYATGYTSNIIADARRVLNGQLPSRPSRAQLSQTADPEPLVANG